MSSFEPFCDIHYSMFKFLNIILYHNSPHQVINLQLLLSQLCDHWKAIKRWIFLSTVEDQPVDQYHPQQTLPFCTNGERSTIRQYFSLPEETKADQATNLKHEPTNLKQVNLLATPVTDWLINRPATKFWLNPPVLFYETQFHTNGERSASEQYFSLTEETKAELTNLKPKPTNL